MTAQAWGVVFGAASVVVVMAGVVAWLIAQALARFATVPAEIAALRKDFADLRVELVGKYVTKEDCREERHTCLERAP